MTDRCQSTRAVLDAYVDAELSAGETEAVAEHLTTCLGCAEEYQTILDTAADLRSHLVRYKAPDVLRARIRTALVTPADDAASDQHATTDGARSERPAAWRRPAMLAAALLFAAALGSGVTLATFGRKTSNTTIGSEVLASHLRSLMPNHLTDIASSDQHNVKPWFNGRLDYSPNVPRFEDQGYPLLGGRLDYIGNRPVAVIVYGRRQHIISVFSWPSPGNDKSLTTTASNGYNMLHWRSGGIEKWVVSDVGAAELKQFAELVQRADAGKG